MPCVLMCVRTEKQSKRVFERERERERGGRQENWINVVRLIYTEKSDVVGPPVVDTDRWIRDLR